MSGRDRALPTVWSAGWSVSVQSQFFLGEQGSHGSLVHNKYVQCRQCSHALKVKVKHLMQSPCASSESVVMCLNGGSS